MFIFTFLATLLIISVLPLSLYLTTDEINDYTELDIALNKFSSYEELKSFLETAEENVFSYDLRSDTLGIPSEQWARPEEPAPTAEFDGSESQNSDGVGYSKTNIQVEGVDEADIVKTDGEYIYVVSGNNVTIIKAYPPKEARVVSKISLNGSISGIYINDEKLALIHNEYTIYLLYGGGIVEDSVGVGTVEVLDGKVIEGTDADELAEATDETKENTVNEEPVNENGTDPSVPSTNSSTTQNEPSKPEEPTILPIEPIVWEPPTTSIKVYDISDKANPKLTRDFSIDGNYFNSRMIGDYIYFIATMYTYRTATDVALPRVHIGDETETIPANEIYYSNLSDNSYSFTTIVALNIMDDSQVPNHETIVLGGTSAIYASQNNIYLTFLDYSWQENETPKTTIHRAKIDEDSITFVAAGEVPGQILNQFSMDENGNYFRIATTIYTFNWRTFDGRESFAEVPTNKNNVYVLDMDLNIVGKLENLAPGEQIYSARFLGNKLYLVTFRNIDPLFVIDLSDPTSPTVLGELKVTGYSGYLHIYDENHVMGIGKETEYDAKEDFAWYLGLKISLFDVSDVSNPVEVAKYEIGDRGTDSPILHDHKSLLFDKEKNLLVIPVSVAEIDENQYEGEIPDWAYGEHVWQGAYVFDMSLDGIELRGRITHIEDGTFNGGYYYYGYSSYMVQRSLYIEDVLYTISNMKVKMNNLENLAEINEIELS